MSPLEPEITTRMPGLRFPPEPARVRLGVGAGRLVERTEGQGARLQVWSHRSTP